jgi:predicted HicB family RNase H-like nuclease
VAVGAVAWGFSLDLRPTPIYCTEENTTVNIIVVDFSVFPRYINSMKKKRGRPPKGPDGGRPEYLDVRLEPAEKQAFSRAAEVAGVSLSAWVRERLRAVARKELQEAGEPVPFLKRSAPQGD